jgi:hypothetical protein
MGESADRTVEQAEPKSELGKALRYMPRQCASGDG